MRTEDRVIEWFVKVFRRNNTIKNLNRWNHPKFPLILALLDLDTHHQFLYGKAIELW